MPSRHHQPSVLDRLAQRFERIPTQLVDLVQKQHPVVRPAQLARLRRVVATADQPGRRDAVMWRPKWRLCDQAAAGSQAAEDGGDGGDLERRSLLKRRHDPGEGAGQERFPRTGRPDK